MPTRVRVFTSVTQVFEEDFDPVKDAVLKAIRRNGDLGEAVRQAHIAGYGAQVDAFYRYGRSKFIRGLPEVHYTDSGVSTEDLHLILKEIEGSPVRVFFAARNTLDVDFLVWRYMAENWDFDITTLEVANPPLDVPEGRVWQRTEINPDNDVVAIFALDATTESVTELTIPIDFEAVDITREYVHAVYVTLDENQEPNSEDIYWLYDTSSGVHTSLETENYDEDNNGFFPVLPLREANFTYSSEDIPYTDLLNLNHKYHSKLPNKLLNEFGSSEPDSIFKGDVFTSKLYRSAKRLASNLGMDYDKVLEGMSENPNIDDVDNAYIGVFAPINSEDPAVKRYLYEFFSRWVDRARLSQDDDEYFRIHYNSSRRNTRTRSYPTSNVFRFTENFLNLAIAFQRATKHVLEGVVGEVGEIQFDSSRDPDTNVFFERYFYRSLESARMTRQISATHYELISFAGLTHFNYAYSDHAVVTRVDEDTFVTPEGEDFVASPFFIPIDRNLAKSFGQRDYNRICQVCTVFIANSVALQDIAWYETEVFKGVLVIVAIVAAAYGAYELAAEIIAAETLLAAALVILVFILKAVVIGVLVRVALDVLIDVFGLEFAAIFAVIVAIVSAFFGDFNFDVGGFLTINAQTFYQMSQIAIQEIAGILQEELGDIQRDIVNLTEEAQQLQDDLDEEFADVVDAVNINPLEFSGVNARYINEPVDVFYYRTVHAGNIGLLTLNQIPNYVDNKLRLDLPDSMIRNRV